MLRGFELSGHRGARGLWPENTLAGFAGALAIGVDAIELDAVLTADGIAVAAHDLAVSPDLARGADGRWLPPPGPAIIRLDAAALAGFDVGRARPGGPTSRAHPRQRAVDGQAIPTLASVFALAAGHPGVRLQVELKTDPDRPEISAEPGRLARAVLDAAAAAGVADRLALRSFDWRGLRAAARIWPGLALAYLTETADDDALDAVLAEAAGARAGWAPGFAGLTPALLDRARDGGLTVLPWTVNRRQDMARLIGWGLDGFCTDDPDVARAVLAECGVSPAPEPRAARSTALGM